ERHARLCLHLTRASDPPARKIASPRARETPIGSLHPGASLGSASRVPVAYLIGQDLVGLAPVDDETDGFGPDEGAVVLAFGIETVIPGKSKLLARFRAASALEPEYVLVGAGDRDDLDDFPRRRKKSQEIGDAAALLPPIAEHLEQDGLVSV